MLPYKVVRLSAYIAIRLPHVQISAFKEIENHGGLFFWQHAETWQLADFR
jgi:hypothetical protein